MCQRRKLHRESKRTTTVSRRPREHCCDAGKPACDVIHRRTDENVPRTLHVDPYVDHEFHYSTQEQALLRKYTQADRKLLVDFGDFSRKQCSAGRNCVNLLPDGQLFTCAGGVHLMHSPLYPELGKEQTSRALSDGQYF